MARRNQRRRPDTVKSAAKGFQQVLDPKRAPPGFTEQDIMRSRSDPSRYGGIYEGAAPSAAPAAKRAPAPAPARPKPMPPRRPRDVTTTGSPGKLPGWDQDRPVQPADDNRPFGIPPGPQVGQGPLTGPGSDRAIDRGYASLPGMPELPGPLSLPDFSAPPVAPPGPLTPGPTFNPPADLGGATINQIPATSPNVPMGGVTQPPAATNTMPRPGISSPGTMPPPPAPAAMAGMPPGLLDPRLLQAALSGYND
jgi:hypothetical protein